MFGINWAIRFKDPHFWGQMLLAIATPIGAYFGLTGADITTWGILWDTMLQAVANPIVLWSIGLSVYNTARDPTTTGIGDSADVLSQTKVY